MATSNVRETAPSSSTFVEDLSPSSACYPARLAGAGIRRWVAHRDASSPEEKTQFIPCAIYSCTHRPYSLCMAFSVLECSLYCYIPVTLYFFYNNNKNSAY